MKSNCQNTIWTSILAILLAMGMAAAAAASTVRYDYDRTVNFSDREEVAWRDPERPDASMTARRIEKALQEGFEERGYSFVEKAEDADFVIEYRLAAWQDVRLEGIRRGPALGRTVYVDREAMGALVVDVYEVGTGRLAWHGVVSDALARDPSSADRKTAKAVEKLLKHFPEQGGDE